MTGPGPGVAVVKSSLPLSLLVDPLRPSSENPTDYQDYAQALLLDLCGKKQLSAISLRYS